MARWILGLVFFVSLLTPFASAQEQAAATANPDSTALLQAQLGAVLESYRSGNQKEFLARLQDFSLPDSRDWCRHAFDPSGAGPLADAYNQAFDLFRSHVQLLVTTWGKNAGAHFQVASSEAPEPLQNIGPEASLPRPVVPVKVEDFLITLAVGDDNPPSFVNSFVRVDGVFRVIGGKFPFWAAGIQQIRAVESGVTSARPIYIVKPIYPKEAKKEKIEGDVVLRVTVATDGTVKDILILSGDPALIDAARDAVLKWRYAPQTVGGQPVESITRATVPFRLRRSKWLPE
ncbi:MAG: energy transducer TonB [Candidatus Acidiferrales bacterium]